MTTALREYQAVVHAIGTEAPSESTIDFVIGIGSDAQAGALFTVPVIEGQKVHPLEGRTDARPFRVEGVDVDGLLTAAFTVSERWRAIGRLVQVRFRDVDSENYPLTDWRYLGTGRGTQFDALDGEGKYRIEVSDEAWKLRNYAQLFEHADTTQWWPMGVVSYWRGFGAAIKAEATRFENEDDHFFVKLLAVGYDGFEGSTQHSGVMITDRLRNAIEADLKPAEERQEPDQVSTITAGNFRHLRLNFGGHDYEILKFSGPADGPILESIETPEEIDGGSGSWAVRIWCWCAKLPDDPEPPSSGEAFLYAPTAEPTEDAPLHGGMADTGHWLGTALGFIHLADLVRRILDLLKIIYDPDNLDAFAADKSFPALSPRITERPDDPMRWLQDNVFQFCQVTHGRDAQGRFKLIDLRPRRTVEEGIPVLDITNAKKHRWLLAGREMINSVNYRVLRLTRPAVETGIRLREGVVFRRGTLGFRTTVEDPTLDNFAVKEETTDPEDGDTLEDSGRRLLTLDARAAAHVGYNDVGLFAANLGKFQVQQRILQSGAGALFEQYKAFTTPSTLATYQDGLRRGTIEVEGILSETLEEGGEFYLDHDSLKIATPGRLGAGLPPGVGPLVPGGSTPALDPAPELGSPTLLSDLRIEVPVDSIPSGLTARVEYAATGDCDDAPDPSSSLYQTAGTRTSVGDVFVPAQPRGACVWLIVSGEEDGVRVTEYSTPILVEIPEQPHFDGALLRHTGGGVYVVTWDPADSTLGVRICWAINEPGSATETPECDDVDASLRTFTIPDVVPIGSQINVTLTPYPGFSGGSVSGTAGQVWPASDIRRETLEDVVATLPIDLSSDDEVENVLALEHGGVPPGGTTGQVLKKQSNADLDADWEDDDTSSGGYPEGTSFPGSPSTGAYFVRSDRGGMRYRYDGSQWLSTTLYHYLLPPIAGTTTSVDSMTAPNPGGGEYAIYVTKARVEKVLAGSGNWTVEIQQYTGNTAGTDLGTTSAFTNTTRDSVDVTINTTVATTVDALNIRAVENSGTATCFASCVLYYRLVG